MKKVFRLFIVSALLLGLFIPLFDHYYNQDEIPALTMAQESRERNIKELFKLAKESFYQGELSSAANYYQEIIENDPFNLESRRNLAVIYNEKNDLIAENEILLKTSILSNQNQDYLNLAINFYELNNKIAANYLLEKKMDENLNDEDLLYKKYYYLIKSNLDLNNLEKAEEYLMKITNLQKNEAQIYILSAELNRVKENYKLAFNDYNSSYQKDRTQTFLFKEMALMLEKAGEEIEAYNYWQRSLGYGWFEKQAYQKINFFQDKYPELRPDKDKEEEKPEEVNPFDLKADWHQVKKLDNEEEIQMLRIGLQEDNQHLLFQYSDPFSVIHNGKIIFKGDQKRNYLIEIEADDLYLVSEDQKIKLGSLTDEYQIYSSRENSSFYVYNINYGQGYFWQGSGNRQYRGSMIIKGEEDAFTLINQVELTPYLISVVPSEIYASWPFEALKAQAVAARSYTLSNLGRHSSDGYDLCSSVHCAAYNGIISENENTTKAVLETQAETAFFEGRVIEAVFSSNSGGFTERSDEIWSADLPYLRGANQMKENDFDFPLEPKELRDWLTSAPESYSKDYGSSNYRWQLKVPAAVISDRSGIDNIKKIEVIERAQGGTITSLKITGENKEEVYSVSRIRRVLGGLKSSRFYYDSHYDHNGYLKELYIYGSGWGHNLGLDQSASAGMGAAGWNYEEIIKHFYPGVEIKKYN